MENIHQINPSELVVGENSRWRVDSNLSELMEEKNKLNCPKCGHEWETKSKLKLVTCPSCQLKVENTTQSD